MISRRNIITFFLALVLLPAWAQVSDSVFKTMKYRCIGPFRGGRSVCGTGVVGDPLVYYSGTTGGGLWKTEDAGMHWKNISDGYFGTGSVGAIAVSATHSNIVYCGMGEHAPRGVMTSYGDGMYKSMDAGKTWKKLGLELTRQISRIIIHPDNPDIIYVAAQGAINGPTPDRGIYKSTDGGQNWKKILFVNNLTGCAELSMDATNPEVLYAAMWHHQRLPWKVISGGPGSGLYKTTDGGKTWKRLEKGLPKEQGKMAIAVSPANPDKVFALIESDSQKELGGLFLSHDAGESWNRVSDDHRLIQRAWYYIEVFADPNDEHTVYVLSASAFRSIDDGKTWERLSGTHGDYHDLWINPDNSKNMLISNDGGSAITYNNGASWSTQSNLPTSQFYRVNTDNLYPYNLYGGQQDNTSVKIASMAPGRSGITREDWHYSAGGESAFLAFDPDNPRYVLGGSYAGTIEALDMKTRSGLNIMAAPIFYLGRETRDMKYRYNWNAPIIWSQHEPGTFYHGAQLVLRTRDLGKTWEEVSPDLSRDEDEKQGLGGGPYTNEAVGAENYGTMSYMVESPHEKGTLWTGSDDGLVHVTRDGGENWTNVTPKGLKETLINAIEVSPHDAATAYIATTRYKFNDFTPGLYKTTNYGKSWTNISHGIPHGAYTRVVREDPNQKGLLYAGTETGMYISWNDGKQWDPFQLNLPITPITDLKVWKNDLIVATAGRSFWILDDLATIQQYTGNPTDFKLYEPENALLGYWRSPLSGSTDHFDDIHITSGINPANGQVFYYQLPEIPDSVHIKLEIKDASGKVVRSYTSQKDASFISHAGGPPASRLLPKETGLNRFVWDMRHETLMGVPHVYIEGSFRGHRVPPGQYTATLSYSNETASVACQLSPNPLANANTNDYVAYDAFINGMAETFNDMHRKVNALKKSGEQIEAVLKDIPSDDMYKDLKAKGKELLKRLKDWDGKMVQRKSKAYDDVENYRNGITAEYLFLINQAENPTPRINASTRRERQALDEQWQVLKATAETLINTEIPAYSKQLFDAGVGVVRYKE